MKTTHLDNCAAVLTPWRDWLFSPPGSVECDCGVAEREVYADLATPVNAADDHADIGGES